MNKKVSLGALITLMAIVAAVTFSMTMVFSMNVFNDKVYNLKEREEIYRKLSEIDKIFRTNYAGEVDNNLLMDTLSSGYARGTGDAYARYYTAEAYQKTTEVENGRIVGIGVASGKDPSGYLVITEIYPNSPAQLADLQVGDYIIQIDGEEVKEDNFTQMQEKLQGEAGTKVNLVIRRNNEDQTLDITRRYVDIPSVYSELIAGNVGYLKITEISDTTDEQFIKQLETLLDQDAQAIVMDLRNNSGGIFDSAIKILDRILPACPVVTATYSDGTVEQFETTDSKELNAPLVVLTNERTAREAEIIAQVLKDYGKAKIVGTQTLGRGTKQETIKLYDGSAITLTTAVYKTPKSESFNLVGVKPDYEVTLTADQEKDFEQLDATTDPQITRAVEVLQALLRADGTDNGVSSPSGSLEGQEAASLESSDESGASSEEESAAEETSSSDSESSEEDSSSSEESSDEEDSSAEE